MKRRLTLILVLILSGCTSMGPQTIDRDRFDYVTAISESWKRQTLLNLLKTRYLDVPIYLDIASVINQYSVEQELGLGLSGEFYNRGDPSFVSPRIGASGKFADRPTISYTPLMGQKFARSVLRPLPLSAILLLLQSGYPADYVLRICAQSIQGLDNRRTGPLGKREADPEFYELLHLMRTLVEMDVISFRSRFSGEKKTMVMHFRKTERGAAAAGIKRVVEILGLDATADEFQVVSGRIAVNDYEIAILIRSVQQIMTDYAAYIDVPDADISEGRVYSVQHRNDVKAHRLSPLLKVFNGASKPGQSYVAVPYRGIWFWIDDRDVHSKAMFSFLVALMSFTERGESKEAAPVIAIPTN